MSKFNQTQTRVNVTPNDTNMAGGVSYKREDLRKEIASVVLNSMINGNSFYESEEDRINRLFELVAKNPDANEFLAKAMVYARNEGNLRSVSHIMGVALVENAKGTTFMRPALKRTFIRPDDATEMVALFNARNEGKMVPNVLRRSIKDALETRWDEYQLKKYAGTKNKVKLKNLVQIAHPSPRVLVETGKAKDVNVFVRVIEDTLDNIQTAQTVNAGSTDADRALNYKNMLSERKLGYMAALKNIKNILEAGADQETVDSLCGLLTNRNAVLKSRVLPFRFTQAYGIVDSLSMDKFKARQILDAIEQGFIYSAGNVSIVEGNEKVALLLDESGSMGGFYGSDNEMTSTKPFMIGKTLMASMMCGLKLENTIGYLWADRSREVTLTDKPFQFIKNTNTQGGGTDVSAPLKDLIKNKTYVDKIVIFSDMQMYGGWGNIGDQVSKYVNKYKAEVNPNVKVLFWNLEGYSGGTPMKLSNDILEISGYSDKFLDVIPKMWKDKDALVNEIENIVL